MQKSAIPEAYTQWEADAEVLSTALAGDAASAVACTLPDAPDQSGASAVTALLAGIRLDWGDVHPAAQQNPLDVALTPRDTRTGWQYANWLVAQAQGHGVKRVRFGDREWQAHSGTWKQVKNAAGATTGQVLAEIYSET